MRWNLQCMFRKHSPIATDSDLFHVGCVRSVCRKIVAIQDPHSRKRTDDTRAWQKDEWNSKRSPSIFRQECIALPSRSVWEKAQGYADQAQHTAQCFLCRSVEEPAQTSDHHVRREPKGIKSTSACVDLHIEPRLGWIEETCLQFCWVCEKVSKGSKRFIPIRS